MSLPEAIATAGRLSRSWAEQMLPGAEPVWPRRVTLRPPETPDTAEGLIALRRWALEVHATATSHGLGVETKNRRIGTLVHPVPHRLTVPSLDHAASIAGAGVVDLIAAARRRLPQLEWTPSGGARDASTVRRVAALTDLDFELLLAVVRWLADNDEADMTARQLPIEGVHGKWIESHGSLVEHLLDRPLRLTKRVQPVTLTWLDPEHRAHGRHHDSYMVGDHGMRPPYEPRLAIVIENKDTAHHFPPVDGAVAILGNGTNLPRLADIPWLRGVPIVYWGDIDAAGYRIVDQLRSQAIPVTTILMDEAAASRYARLGVRHQPNGALISERRRSLDRLEPDEAAVYEQLTDPGRSDWLRIEQERIPFGHAVAAIAALGY